MTRGLKCFDESWLAHHFYIIGFFHHWIKMLDKWDTEGKFKNSKGRKERMAWMKCLTVPLYGAVHGAENTMSNWTWKQQLTRFHRIVWLAIQYWCWGRLPSTLLRPFINFTAHNKSAEGLERFTHGPNGLYKNSRIQEAMILFLLVHFCIPP